MVKNGQSQCCLFDELSKDVLHSTVFLSVFAIQVISECPITLWANTRHYNFMELKKEIVGWKLLKHTGAQNILITHISNRNICKIKYP